MGLDWINGIGIFLQKGMFYLFISAWIIGKHFNSNPTVFTVACVDWNLTEMHVVDI
jgi:hypothetical protein